MNPIFKELLEKIDKIGRSDPQVIVKCVNCDISTLEDWRKLEKMIAEGTWQEVSPGLLLIDFYIDSTLWHLIRKQGSDGTFVVCSKCVKRHVVKKRGWVSIETNNTSAWWKLIQ